MARGFLPEKGDQFAPCDACEHKDCALQRQDLNSDCSICGEGFTWGAAYYRNDKGGIDHALCVEEQAK